MIIQLNVSAHHYYNALQDGDSALDVAAKFGKLDIVEFLLSKGASTYIACRANKVSYCMMI